MQNSIVSAIRCDQSDEAFPLFPVYGVHLAWVIVLRARVLAPLHAFSSFAVGRVPSEDGFHTLADKIQEIAGCDVQMDVRKDATTEGVLSSSWTQPLCL